MELTKKAQKNGYLKEHFRLFHITEINRKTFDFHYHDFYKLLLLVQGNVSYNIEGNVYRLRPMDIVLINHGEIHMPVIERDCTYERFIIYIQPSFLAQYKNDTFDLSKCFQDASQNNTHILRLPKDKRNTIYLKMLALEKACQDTELFHELLENNAFLDLLVTLNRLLETKNVLYLENDKNKSTQLKMAPVLEYINTHLTADLSMDALSSALFLSKSYLMHTFKEETGYTIGSYITNKRLFLARSFITQGMPITQACYQAGFDNYTTFSRAYKKTFHEPPRQLTRS